jgi:shikimate kinase
MNIVLIGYRGTGKSAVARVLAERTGREVVSTDARIVEVAGRSIPEIVDQHGWEYFRDIESGVVDEVATRDGIIIDAGGGVVIRDRNIEALRKNGKLFWLVANVDTIVKRIGADDQRPSLTGEKSFIEEIDEVLAQRLPLYRAAAHYSIETDTKTIESMAQSIISILKI